MIPKARDSGEAAQYIAKLAGDLKHIAMSNELDFLAYLLGMAEEEAASEASKGSAKPRPAIHPVHNSETR